MGMKRWIAFAISMLLFGTLAAPANGAEDSLRTLSEALVAHGDSQEEIDASIAFMVEQGISYKDQVRLLEMTLQGIPHEADIESSVPLRENRAFSGNSGKVTQKFSDGSVRVTEVTSDQPLAEVQPDDGEVSTFGTAISGCTNSSGSGYATSSNCHISYSTISFKFGFYATYTFAPSAPGTINSVKSPYVTYALGHYELYKELLINKKTGTTASPANAFLRIAFVQNVTAGSQITKGVKLFVGSSSAWTSAV